MGAPSMRANVRVRDSHYEGLLQVISFFNDQVNNLLGFGVVDDRNIPHAGWRRTEFDRSRCWIKSKTELGGTQLGYFHDKLENKLQRKLDQARVAVWVGGRYLSESVARGSAIEATARNAEARVIEQIKELRPEFQAKPFANHRSLERGEIEVVDTLRT